MREINKIAEGLFEKIRDRFEDVSLGDENAHATQDPQKARFFNFDYVVDGHNYGNITLSVIDETSLKVYFSKNISHDLDEERKKHWYSFLRELREFAKRNLLSFEPRDITRSTLKHRDIQQQSKADSTYDKDEVIGESRLYGTSRSSYENDGPVRLIIRHSDHINPEQRGSRSRKIRAMYLETAEGERFKLPYNSLRYGRAMARHIQEGGILNDEFGQHITEIAEECSKLRPFKASMIRRVFEDEETQAMVEAAFEYHGLLKDTLGKMSGRKGYQQCKEQFVATSTSYVPEDEYDADSIRERFVKRTYNERMNDALPIVYKAYNMKKSNKMAEAFESWASNVAESWDEDEEGVKQWGVEPVNVDDLVDLFDAEVPLGVDGANAIMAVENIIQNDDLIHMLVHAGKTNPEGDARELILNWVEENLPAVAQELSNELSLNEMSGTGDTPFNSMSRSELLDYLNLDPLKAQQLSNEELRSAAEERSQDMTEGNTYGSYGAVYEDDDDSTDAIANAIVRRILTGCGQGNERCLALLRKLGPEGIVNSAVEIAEFAGPVDEIGSSDVSGWVAQLMRDAGIELDEDYGSYAPSDSASPLTHAHEEYCDACDSTECHCDELDEGRMKDIDIDLSQLTDEEFLAKYGKTKEEMKQALAEGLTGLQKLGAGAALVGALAGNAYMGQKSIEADPYVQKLEQKYEQVLKASDKAYARGDMETVQQLDDTARNLENAIEDAKASAELGIGSENDFVNEMKRLSGLK